MGVPGWKMDKPLITQINADRIRILARRHEERKVKILFYLVFHNQLLNMRMYGKISRILQTRKTIVKVFHF